MISWNIYGIGTPPVAIPEATEEQDALIKAQLTNFRKDVISFDWSNRTVFVNFEHVALAVRDVVEKKEAVVEPTTGGDVQDSRAGPA